MPVDLLTNDQKEGYGRYSYELNDAELAGCFHLDDADISFIKTRRGDFNRLGIALQLTTVRFLGTFLPNPTDVPISVIAFVADQIDVFETGCLASYMDRKVTRYTHVNDIKRQHGYSEFNSPQWRFRLTQILYSRSWISNDHPSLLFEFSISWLLQHKILLPGITTLTRLISEVRERATSRLWRKLAATQ